MKIQNKSVYLSTRSVVCRVCVYIAALCLSMPGLHASSSWTTKIKEYAALTTPALMVHMVIMQCQMAAAQAHIRSLAHSVSVHEDALEAQVLLNRVMTGLDTQTYSYIHDKSLAITRLRRALSVMVAHYEQGIAECRAVMTGSGLKEIGAAGLACGLYTLLGQLSWNISPRNKVLCLLGASAGGMCLAGGYAYYRKQQCPAQLEALEYVSEICTVAERLLQTIEHYAPLITLPEHAEVTACIWRALSESIDCLEVYDRLYQAGVYDKQRDMHASLMSSLSKLTHYIASLSPADVA